MPVPQVQGDDRAARSRGGAVYSGHRRLGFGFLPHLPDFAKGRGRDRHLPELPAGAPPRLLGPRSAGAAPTVAPRRRAWPTTISRRSRRSRRGATPRSARPVVRRSRRSRSGAATARHDFDTVDPLSVADLRVQARTQERADSSKKSVVAVFVLSIFGLLAPLMLVVSLVYTIRKRDQLSRCGPVFVIMSWASVVLSALYSVLLLLFFLLGH